MKSYSSFFAILVAIYLSLGINSFAQVSNPDATDNSNLDNTNTLVEKGPGGGLVSAPLSCDVRIHPGFQLGRETFRRLISLASENEPVDSKGYRLQESFKMSGGLGLGIAVDAGADLELGFGLMAIKGKSSFSDQFVKDASEAKSARALRLPKTAQDLSTWSPGDRLVFSSMGGLLVKLAYIFSPIGLSASHLVNGEWVNLIQKDAETGWVTVELSHLKTKSVSVAASAPGGWTSLKLASLSTSWFRQLENETVLRFNLQDSLGMELFNKAIHGNWKAAQEVAELNSDSVRWLSSGDNHTTGRLTSFKVGLPFLFSFNYSKSHFLQESTTVNHKDGVQVQSWTTSFFKESKTAGMLSKKKSRSLNIIGESQIKTDPKGKVEKANIGQISFSYERDDIEASDIDKALEFITKKTGIYKPFKISWPSGNLEYAHIDFTVDISEDVLQKLFDLTRSEQILNRFFEIGMTLQSDYDFQNDPFLFCSHNPNQNANQKDGVDESLNGIFQNNTGENCQQAAQRSFQKAANLIREKLIALMMADSQKDNQVFAESLAQLGQQILSSPFVFQTVETFTKELGEPLMISLKIEGSRFGKVQRVIQ